MVKIIQSNDTDDPAGMDAMRAIVQRRLAAAQVPEDTAFDTGDTLDYVCRMSGGHVRNLLILSALLGLLPAHCRSHVALLSRLCEG